MLRPKRTHNGYRAYSEQDLARLEQIVLRFVGLHLRRIKALLDRDGRDLPGTLRIQRSGRSGPAGAGRDADQIIEVPEMQNDAEWTMKY